MQVKIGSVVAALCAVTFISGHAQPVLAYGPEGLFGGRPQPDSSIVIGNPLDLKNDRPDRAESVLDHPRPDFDPSPIEVGSFELFPTLEVGQTYDSNIYVSKSGAKDDLINTVRPIVSMFSNWGRHALSMTTYGDINFYDTHGHEDYQNFVSEWNGRYDIVNQSWFSVRGGFQHLSESRASPDSTAGTEPTTFNLVKGGLGYYRGIGLLKVNADYDVRRYDFQDTKTSTTTVIDQSGRNHYEHVIGSKVSYDWSGNVKPYINAHVNDHTYDNNATLQSQGYDAVVGSTFDFGGITSLEVYAGAMGQNYRNFTAGDKNVFAPKFGGRVDWNVTGLTSVVLEVSRTIEDTTVTNFNSYVATGGSMTVTHELLRNLLLEGNFGFTRDDFNGASTRQDDNIATGMGARYYVNRHIYSDLSYHFGNRSSTDSTADYDRHLVMLRVGFRL